MGSRDGLGRAVLKEFNDGEWKTLECQKLVWVDGERHASPEDSGTTGDVSGSGAV